MIAAAHQPNYIPWIGYFYKLWLADCMVVLDNVQYTKNGFQNRNRIKTQRGSAWLTVPVVTAGRLGQATKDVEIVPGSSWYQSHLDTIRQNYRRAPYFLEYFPALEALYKRPWRRLVDLNLALIRFLAAALEIRTPLVLATELNVTGKGSALLVDLCCKVHATRYLSGFGGRSYQDSGQLADAGITLEVYDFKHPTYPQLWGEFIPQLTVLDLLLNCGPAAAHVVRSSGGQEGNSCARFSS